MSGYFKRGFPLITLVLTCFIRLLGVMVLSVIITLSSRLMVSKAPGDHGSGYHTMQRPTGLLSRLRRLNP